MNARARSSVFLLVVALLSLASATAPRIAAAHPSMAVAPESTEGWTGVVSRRTWRIVEGRSVADDYFQLPDAVVRQVTLGSVIEPDDPAQQRVLVVERGVGYCIDYGRHSPTSSTRFRYRGMRLDELAHRAAVARRHDEPASYLVWAVRGSVVPRILGPRLPRRAR